MTDTITPEFIELMQFMRLLDRFPHMNRDTKGRLYVATIGADNENERQVHWASIWGREAEPGTTLRMLVLRENRDLAIRQIPTAEQIIHALKAHAEHDKKENAK